MRLRLVVAAILLAVAPAFADGPPDPGERSHPPDHQTLHEKFYSTWYMPDNPARSCCNKADCYPTEARFHNGHWQGKRREDGKWLFIPEAKIERNRDNPDGRNHMCAPPPMAPHPADTVFCFTLGSGI